MKFLRPAFLLVVAICTVLMLTGCSAVPKQMAKLVDALAKDPATVHLRMPTPWGVIELDRTAPTATTAPHTVKDGAITVGELK